MILENKMHKDNIFLRVAYMLTLIGICLSPLYLWESGLPQIWHIFIFLSTLFHFLYLSRSAFRFRLWWVTAFLFSIYAFFVNFLIYLIYYDVDTFLSGIYYIFNFIVWFHIVQLGLRFSIKHILISVYYILWILLMFELVLIFAGIGRMYGVLRFIGTFNDPNQMAHWFLWVAVLLSLLAWTLYRSWVQGAIATGLVTIGILFTLSRSGMLGLAILICTYVILALRYLVVSLNRAWSWAVLLSTGLLLFVTIWLAQDILVNSWDALTGNRLTLLIERFQDNGAYTSLEGRGYDRLWKFPEYLFLGAGEGANDRWSEKTWFLGEIHSTFAGALFYYGIIGTIFIIFFLYNIWIRINNFYLKLCFLSILLYGTGTYNLRNSFFWIGLSIIYLSSYFHKSMNKNFCIIKRDKR